MDGSQLSLEHLDLYLVHTPPSRPLPGDVERLWDNMIDVRKAGLTRYAEAACPSNNMLDLARRALCVP
jgi:aryl-alcohol dehydrogenase-like predicted oxidoreductase